MVSFWTSMKPTSLTLIVAYKFKKKVHELHLEYCYYKYCGSHSICKTLPIFFFNREIKARLTFEFVFRFGENEVRLHFSEQFYFTYKCWPKFFIDVIFFRCLVPWWCTSDLEEIVTNFTTFSWARQRQVLITFLFILLSLNHIFQKSCM